MHFFFKIIHHTTVVPQEAIHDHGHRSIYAETDRFPKHNCGQLQIKCFNVKDADRNG